MADLNVGSFGKKSNIDLKKLQAGMKAEQLQTKEEKSIFNKVDKDGNGVIDADELNAFSEGLDKSNDGKVSRKEARKFIKKNGLKGEVKKKDVLKFLNANVKNTENVEDAKVVEQNGQKLVQVTYKDGTQEIINPDKSSQLIQSDGNGNSPQNMNAKKLSFLLLILVAVACTNRSTSSEQDEMRHWNNVLQQINALLLENKARQTLDLAKQTLPEILESAEKNGTTDTLIYYARKIFNACGNNYINTKQYKDGIDYMDSIGNHPLIREHCPHELLSFKAGLNQLYGNNPEAVRLAEDYLQLPVCTSANDFIRQAEIISGVYMYSGNNLPKAIQILEKAIDVYRKGGNFPNMLRIMSRLGIYYHLSGEYEKAIATNQEAIATYNDSIAPGNVVIAYGEQANLYAELGMYDQALEMNKKAQYYSMLKDSFGLGDLYRYRAQIFRNMNQKDSVFHYLRLGEKLSMIQNSFKGVFVNKVETVNSYLDYPDSLEKALQLALSICPDTVRMPQWAKYQLNLHLGRALLQTGKEQNGIHLIDRAAQDLINMKFMEGRDANEILMDYYLAKGMNDDFARCYIRNRQFADSLDNNEKKRAVAAANIRFDANQKEKENKLLSAQVQWQQQQLFYNICISITLLLLLITTTAYFIIRRKANHQLIENNKREIQTLITRQQDLNRRNEQLTEEIERAMATNNLNSIRQLTVQSLLSREDENTFRRSFATIHPSYLPKLRESYPQLTRNEELLAMLICMNQSTDEIALIMGINRNSVNVVRSRMRKNMELPKEKSLDEVLKQYLT